MNNGWIKLYRKLLESEIFYSKPAEWLKIWIYILCKVNYIKGKLPIGSNFFRRDWEKITDQSSRAHITEYQWDSCIRFLKKKKKIATQKTTRGSIIKVLKYEIYQGGVIMENDKSNQTQTKHKPNTNQTISKELIRINKNDKENTNTTKSSLQESNINNLMTIYQKKFPEQRKLYGMGGVIRVRDYFEEIIKSGFTHKEIEIAINKANDSAPWNIIKPKKPESPLKRALREKKENFIR